MPGNRALWLNVNGRRFDFTSEASTDPSGNSRIKIYNLFPYNIYAVDIYIISNNLEAMTYISERNTDSTPKFRIVLDEDFPHDIAADSPGLKFSNPITYYRHDITGKDTSWLPTNSPTQQPFQFIGGSDQSSAGKDWCSFINNPYEPAKNTGPTRYSKDGNALDHTINNSVDDYLSLTIVKTPLTVIEDLSYYLDRVTIVVQPSQFVTIDPSPQYCIDEDSPPQIVNVNIRY